jgi:hypothetical protein
LKNYVYLSRIPKSGLGNQLFSLNALIQTAQHFEVGAIRPASASRAALEMVRPGLLVKRGFQTFRELIPATTVLSSAEQILENDALFRATMIKAPLLGESFQQLTKRDPLLYFHNPQPLSWAENGPYIAAHFRGGDFAKWNPTAILNLNFYLRAIDFALEAVGKNVPIYLSTDDPSLPSYLGVLERYRSRLVNKDEDSLGKRKPAALDFRALAGAEMVVSSPSTFAIWACILGKRRAIHSHEWVEQQVQKDDQFWRELTSKESLYYSCEALL